MPTKPERGEETLSRGRNNKGHQGPNASPGTQFSPTKSSAATSNRVSPLLDSGQILSTAAFPPLVSVKAAFGLHRWEGDSDPQTRGAQRGPGSGWTAAAYRRWLRDGVGSTAGRHCCRISYLLAQRGAISPAKHTEVSLLPTRCARWPWLRGQVERLPVLRRAEGGQEFGPVATSAIRNARATVRSLRRPRGLARAVPRSSLGWWRAPNVRRNALPSLRRARTSSSGPAM